MRNVTGASKTKSAVDNALRSFFLDRNCRVKAITIPVDNATKYAKSFAFVEFLDRSSLVAALTLSRSQCRMGERTLEITECTK